MKATLPYPTDAQLTNVAKILHAQADRLTAQAADTVQHATAARTTTTWLDARADDLQQRADRLHAQADQLLSQAQRTP